MSEKLQNVLQSCGPQLHALLLRLVLRHGLAEELLQELWVKLLYSPGFQNARDPRAYAFRAAIHLALDARRQRTFATLPDSLVSDVLSPAECLIRMEHAELLLAAVAELSPLAREATVLHFIRQMTYDEVSQVMGKSSQQVRGLCSDAMRQLRTKLRVDVIDEVQRE